MLRLSVHLHAQREQAHVAWRSADALGHLALHGQHQARRLETRLQQVADDSRGDVVRDIGHHQVARLAGQYRRVNRQDIALGHDHIGKIGQHLLEQRDQVLIQLDRGHTPRGARQVARQVAQTRANLQHHPIRGDLGRGDHGIQCRWVDEEILTKAFFG